jgi:hypothetical protein
VINLASLVLAMTQKTETPATNIAVGQTVRSRGFDSFNTYVLDDQTQEKNVPIFGAVAAQAGYVKKGKVSEEGSLGHSLRGM